MRVIKADLAVMGSGIAGLSAALRAQKAGLKVALFEKRGFQGGSVSNCPMCVFTIRPEREFQEAAFNAHMKYVNWAGNPQMVRTVIKYSSQIESYIEDELGLSVMAKMETPLEDVGVKSSFGCFDAALCSGDTLLLKGIGLGHGAAVICKKAADLLRKAGGEIYFNMPITKLICEGDSVIGAEAFDRITKENVRIEAKAVAVCAGGCIDDEKMLKEELGVTMTDKRASGDGDVVKICFNNGQQTGDGLKAVWAIGGAKGSMWLGTGTNVPQPGGAGDNCPWMQPTQLMTLVEQPYLTVNKRGERFISENISDLHMAKYTTFAKQPNRAGFIIFDADVAHKIETVGVEKTYTIFDNPTIPNLTDQFKQIIEEGNKYVFLCDTIHELCEKTGIDEKGLTDTIERYNKACQEGYDDDFFVKPEWLFPVKKAPFYCVQPVTSGYSTVGGIRINGKCEVLNTELNPIKGLYAAGNCVLTEAFGEVPYGATSMCHFAFSLGFAVADRVQEYVKE